MSHKLIIVVILLLCLCGVAAQGAQNKKPVSPETVTGTASPPAPVILDDLPLFYIREKVLSFRPQDRARAITLRLDKLARDPFVRIEAITVVDADTTTDIVTGDMVIMTVTEVDAEAEGRPRQLLAREHAAKIRDALEKHRKEYSVRSLILGILYSLAATAVLIALLILLKRLFPKMFTIIDSWRGTRIRSVRFQSLVIIEADRIVAILKGIAGGARLVLLILLFYFYVPLVFSFFPWTRGFAVKLLDYMVAPFAAIGEAIWSYLPKLFFVAVIILITLYVIKLIRLFFVEVGKGTITLPGFYQDWADPTFKIVRFLVAAFAVVVAFPYLPGSESPAFKGVSIFLGVLLSLGSTSAIANIVAGVFLTYTRAFKIGDRVRIADTVGDITEKTLLVTRIRTIKNVEITIPNSLVLSGQVSNYNTSAADYGLILHTRVTIGYDAPWQKVHELLIEAAKATEHILPLPEPFVLQTSLDDFYVTYEVNAYTDKPQRMATIYSELHRNIQDTFNRAGVEIMSPHYSQLRDGNRTAVPADFLPEGYEAPALRISQVGGKDGEKTSCPSHP
jgi:small-conductance mechanosensitive channel